MDDKGNMFRVPAYIWSASTLVVLILCISVHGESFFCKNEETVTIYNISSGSIITRERDTNHYADNLHCAWQLEAGRLQEAINIKVINSDLEWAPEGAICLGYDYITVYDGNTSLAPMLLQWCGKRNPYSITSSGSALYIEFITSDRNQYPRSGIELEFQIFERKLTEKGCPPDWVDNLDLANGGKYCYKLSDHEETWTMAQIYCNYDQANLVSFTTETEESFVTEMISKAIDEHETVWLSLNDIEVDGQYKWLDGTNLSFTRWADARHKSDSYFNCVTMNKNGYWQEDFCNENDIHSAVNHRFVCEKDKVGTTTIYPIPAERPTKGGEGTVYSKLGLIIGVIIGCLVLTVILGLIIMWYYRSAKFKGLPNQANKHRGVSGETRQQYQQSGAAVSSQNPTPSAPPQHDEPQPQQTVVVVVQQPYLPEGAPPSYEESLY